MRGIFPHELKPIRVDEFLRALAVGREKVDDGRAMDLEAMEISVPVADPERFRRERAADDMTSRMLGIMDYFGADQEAAFSCEFRRSYLMKLISKRKFRRYRQVNNDGSLNIHEAFLKAVCEMRFPSTMLRRPRRLKHVLAQEVERQVAIERREELAELGAS